MYREALVPKIAHLLKALYERDILDEETIIEWFNKVGLGLCLWWWLGCVLWEMVSIKFMRIMRNLYFFRFQCVFHYYGGCTYFNFYSISFNHSFIPPPQHYGGCIYWLYRCHLIQAFIHPCLHHDSRRRSECRRRCRKRCVRRRNPL